jgi:hypothetical protein
MDEKVIGQKSVMSSVPSFFGRSMRFAIAEPMEVFHAEICD